MTSLLDQQQFNHGLLDFLQRSPTAFHACENMAHTLEQNGFIRLRESASWDLKPGQRYVVTRNDSSVLAFVYGTTALLESGIRMVGAHTDSPCLKIKPQPELNRRGYYQLGVEVYGGALLAPWFDRDLSIAGRVSYRTQENKVSSELIDFKDPIATIPSLAIHLDREANRSRSINPQKDIVPVLLQLDEQSNQTQDFRQLLLEYMRQHHADVAVKDVLDFELSLYDTQPPSLVGLHKDFIASARLDNLLSCYVGMEALLKADSSVSSLLICTDHEEIGSTSCCGARGPMLQQFLERLLPDIDSRVRVLDRSLMVSADNAHGIHPNFSDRHDENHGPLLNRGPVIKVNANQRYATNSETSAVFRLLCEQAQVPVQSFVSRTDMECGSTIGPLTAAEVGVNTIDVGVPTFAMHSIRELAGTRDAWQLYCALSGLYRYPDAPGDFGQVG